MTREQAIEWLKDAYDRRCTISLLGSQFSSFGMTQDRVLLEEALSVFSRSERWRIRTNCWHEVLDRKIDVSTSSDKVAKFASSVPFELLVIAALDVVAPDYMPCDGHPYKSEYQGRE